MCEKGLLHLPILNDKGELLGEYNKEDVFLMKIFQMFPLIS